MAELHFDAPDSRERTVGPWYQDMQGYHWFVLLVASLAWLFDCLDQQLFNLARKPAMEDLLKGTDLNITAYGYYATGIFLIGWGTGGLIFGALGDRVGRAKTMMVCILIYSACTGLSALSQGFWDFGAYRFLTGLGVGGVFAVGVTLVAETVPSSSRAGALGLLQALSTVGNVSATGIGFLLGFLSIPHAWRWMFVVGALPAAMAVMVQRKVKEPELWLKAKAEGKIAGGPFESLADLFRHPVWRKRALLGLVIGCAGIIGFWGIGVFSNDLVRSVLKESFKERGYEPAQLDSTLTTWTSIHWLVFNVGGFTGMMLYARFARILGRKPTFAVAFILAFAATIALFQGWHSQWQVFWLSPILGFCQLGVFALYAIYFPELFPTNLRSTGTSFCYNVGRFVAAGGTIIEGFYATQLATNSVDTLRSIGSWAALVYLVGLVALPFAPETKGMPLPE
jgi:MFS family permease